MALAIGKSRLTAFVANALDARQYSHPTAYKGFVQRIGLLYAASCSGFQDCAERVFRVARLMNYPP